MPTKQLLVLAIMALGFLTNISTSHAEVRLGKNVRIGGHDASNQTFTKKKRGLYYIYENEPKNPGCKWVKNRDGSKTKVCRLKRKK